MGSYSPIEQETLDTIAALGFDVYQASTGFNTYLYYSDGKCLAYMQRGAHGGLEISTVHIPNRESGTGFRITEDRDPPLALTRHALEQGFALGPNWASQRDLNSVKKWPSVDAWLQAQRLIPYIKVREAR